MSDKKKEKQDEKNSKAEEQASLKGAGKAAASEDRGANKTTEQPKAPDNGVEPPVDTLDDLKQQLEAQGDRYLRLMAEFDNFKKRVSRDYERLVESANERLIGELIEIRENFERAVKSGEQCNDAKSVFDGLKLIYTKFDSVLEKNGLESFAAKGEPFNPELHDALMKTPSEEVPEDHIAEVFEKGYSLKKRVIRHAKVIVSAGKTEKGKDVSA
jgi:molecular chaperone GrpE